MGRLLLAIVTCTLSVGCMQVTFTPTVKDYLPHKLAVEPEVFIDRLPSWAYDSVGIIEVKTSAGTDLTTVLKAVKKKGQEIGCEIVVDRAIHRVGAAGLPRWTVAATTAGDRPWLPEPPRRSASPYFGYGLSYPYSAPSQTQPTYSSGPTQVDTREFICGMYRRDAPPSQPPP
jgi:hypothetical protein